MGENTPDTCSISNNKYKNKTLFKLRQLSIQIIYDNFKAVNIQGGTPYPLHILLIIIHGIITFWKNCF